MAFIDITIFLAALPDDITRVIEMDMRIYLSDLRESSSAYLQWADIFICKKCGSEMYHECVFADIEDRVPGDLLCPECVGSCEKCAYPTKGYMCEGCWWISAIQAVESEPLF